MPSSFDSLDVELLNLIFGFLEESPSSIKSVAAVNRYFHAVSRLVAHRNKEVVFDYDHGVANKNLQKWLDNDGVLRGVRHLTIKGRTDPRPWDGN